MFGNLLMNYINQSGNVLPGILFGLFCFVCNPESQAGADQSEEIDQPRLFIVGQDLGSIRDYYDSDCCVKPDGNTAYINLLSEQHVFSALGIDAEGNELDIESDFGAGKANVRKTATEFPGGLAIGLEFVENNHPNALSQLIDGHYDDHIGQLAHFINMIDEPVWLRVGYEFDGMWNQGYGDPEKYKAAYRHVVDKLREANVGNVEYVWQASTSPVDDMIEKRFEDISTWYPGDAYVDWIGTSWFLTIDEGPTVATDYKPASQRELTDQVLAFARSRAKPVMIAESSPQGYDLAENLNANIAPVWDGKQKGDIKSVSDSEIWDAWYAPLFQYMNENEDVIRALAYINANWDAQPRWGAPHAEGYWGDSRLQVNPEIARRFNLAITEWRRKNGSNL
jgi:hypothetical protein